MSVKHDDILKALTARTRWEGRQSTWYQMRHDGLRRTQKPYKGAADMHFPLADMQIEKQKPVYIQQLFAVDQVATFVARKQELVPYQAAAAAWFDFVLKQHSNLEEEITIGADYMLQSGKCPVKVYWDSVREEVRFDAINPLYVIVPPWTRKLAEADWIVHVQHFSRAAYQRREEFDQDEALIRQISGKDNSSSTTHEQEKTRREGLTVGSSEDEIVIWEVFSQDKSGAWQVSTYSPMAPEKPVRPTFGLPYNKGIFKKGVPPFGELNAEVKDKGFYSARGLCERLAPFEASLSKDWNTQKDYQSFACAPMFSAPNGLQNGQQNVRMVPGQILPFAVEAVQFPPMPMDLGMQMNQTRIIAEQLVATPDFGATQGGSKPRSATEIKMVGNVHGMGMDLRARIFRRELGHLLRLAWGLCLQFTSDSIRTYYRDELQELPPEALSDEYLIEPSGSGDNLNREFMLYKAIARKQMFTGNPNIDQLELDKTVLEVDQPGLVKRLMLNQGTQAAEQMEDQAQEISIMLLGYPAQVRPTDDDAAHLQALMSFVQRRNGAQEPLTAEQMRLVATHGEQHLAELKKKNPQIYAQAKQQVEPILKQLAALATQVEQVKAAQMGAVDGGRQAQGGEM